MSSFNFGHNDKQQKLPFKENKNEVNKQTEDGDQSVGSDTTHGRQSNNTEIQMEIRPGDNKPSTREQTTLPDSGYRYPD